MLSISYRRVNDIVNAVRILSKAIERYPKYSEAYLARGQIYIFKKSWEKAINDFSIAIRLLPGRGVGY